jgi:hypothetical protein
MLVLLDHGTPRGLAPLLAGHVVREAKAQGWDTLSNGALLTVAKSAGFDVLVIPDKNIQYQNLRRPSDCDCGSRHCALACSAAAR